MLFKILSILSLILISGCKTPQGLPPVPKWPSQVKSHFYLDFNEHGEPVCYSFEILSIDPYVLGEPILMNDAKACRGLSGFLPHEMKDIVDYKDQSLVWVKKVIERCKK